MKQTNPCGVKGCPKVGEFIQLQRLQVCSGVSPGSRLLWDLRRIPSPSGKLLLPSPRSNHRFSCSSPADPSLLCGSSIRFCKSHLYCSGVHDFLEILPLEHVLTSKLNQAQNQSFWIPVSFAGSLKHMAPQTNKNATDWDWFEQNWIDVHTESSMVEGDWQIPNSVAVGLNDFDDKERPKSCHQPEHWQLQS